MILQSLDLTSTCVQHDEFLRRAILELDAQISLVIETPIIKTQSPAKKVVTK